MKLPDDVQSAIDAIKTPEARQTAAIGIVLMTGTSILQKLESAKALSDKLAAGLKALEYHDFDTSIVEKTSTYIEAAILKFMELAEATERRLLND